MPSTEPLWTDRRSERLGGMLRRAALAGALGVVHVSKRSTLLQTATRVS